MPGQSAEPTKSAAPSTVSTLSATRSPALDGIRAIAVLLVVALHAGFLVHPVGAGLPRSYVPGGFAGVDVFFVLSGFLITTLLLQERTKRGAISYRWFYIRRGLRLLPALAALLVVHLLYAIQQGRPLLPELKALTSIAFYASNFTQSFHYYMPRELVHTWTLAVEEQFYLVWPVALTLILAWRARHGRSSRWPVPSALVVALIVTNVVRIIEWKTQGYPAAYELPYCHADGLVIGAMLAFAHHNGRPPRRGAEVAGWAGLVFLLAFAVFWVTGSDANAIYYGGPTVLALASAAVINAVLLGSGRLTRLLSWRPMIGIGRVSYGLYLWHVMVLEILVEHTLGLSPWPRLLVALAITAAATLASWWLIEQPALRLKDRFEPITLSP